ncbi:MAG: TadE/TadG family type IV pilus assembly protein [Dermatophilaceae bacterium]
MTTPPARSPYRRRTAVRQGWLGAAHSSRRDLGSLSLEMAILFPLVLTLTFGALQAGLWFEARSMCQAAAQAGVRAGKVLNAPSGAGAGAARSYLADVAGSLVVGPSLSEGRTAATVTVRCSGQAQNVIPLPGFEISVTQSANAGIERFTLR